MPPYLLACKRLSIRSKKIVVMQMTNGIRITIVLNGSFSFKLFFVKWYTRSLRSLRNGGFITAYFLCSLMASMQWVACLFVWFEMFSNCEVAHPKLLLGLLWWSECKCAWDAISAEPEACRDKCPWKVLLSSPLFFSFHLLSFLSFLYSFFSFFIPPSFPSLFLFFCFDRAKNVKY